MTRRRWLLLALAGIVAWFALKNTVYRSILTNTALPEFSAADYMGDEGWAILPIETPPGAWIDPWGIDLYILPSPSGVPAGAGLVGPLHPPTAAETTQHVQKVADALGEAGPSYSAMYRHRSPAQRTSEADWEIARGDATRAFEQYLRTHNNWRGIVLIAAPGSEELLSPLLTRISGDPRLVERFGGVLFLNTSGAVPKIDMSCSPALNDDCSMSGKVRHAPSSFGWLIPQLHRRSAPTLHDNPDILAAALVERTQDLSVWLDANAPKPAEPLGGLEDIEVIEIAPIRRPGETDETQPSDAE